jgi:hypothetical protein
MAKTSVYLEIGKKRVFAGAIEWPGWCRSARSEDEALEALIAYGAPYKKALRAAARELAMPKSAFDLRVVERLEGNAATDFGAPDVAPSRDGKPLDAKELRRQIKLLEACWSAFDRAAEGARGVELKKGPRGGGRDIDKMIGHVLEADLAYVGRVWVRPKLSAADPAAKMRAVREAMIDALERRANGEMPERPRGGSVWSPRYTVRRSAWHALDHLWEIEERSARGG